MRVTKRIDLPLLRKELTAAGVPHRGLAHSGSDSGGELFTYQQQPNGVTLPVDLPPEAVPVVDAHIAPQRAVEYAGANALSAVMRTTNATEKEILRIPTQANRVYRLTLRVTGIDAGNGTTKDIEARVVFKRIGSTISQVGATAVLSNFQDASASTWTVTPSVQSGDVLISVKGAAGRNVDWLVVGEIGMYAPGGV